MVNVIDNIHKCSGETFWRRSGGCGGCGSTTRSLLRGAPLLPVSLLRDPHLPGRRSGSWRLRDLEPMTRDMLV